MGLKAAVKRLEKDLSPGLDVIVYALDGPLSREDGGMIKVIQWGKPGWEEIITYEEHDRRIAEAIARGDKIVGPGWND